MYICAVLSLGTGPKGGLAVAEVLAGAVVPSGRLPFTYPRSAGDIPYAYHHKPGDQCVDPVTHAYIHCQVLQYAAVL